MSRFRAGDLAGDSFDPYDDFDDDRRAAPRSRRRTRHLDDEPVPRRSGPPVWDQTDDDPDVPDDARRTSYPDATHGPQPVPGWVVTSAGALDYERGVVKTGKEADVDLLERVDLATGEGCLLAAKRYRSGHHRLFHRDAGYLEGRRVRRSRETRAMARRTEFGRELISGQWAFTEFEILGRLWAAGVAVPYPVQLHGTELLLEFIGDPDGAAAPRLAELRPDRDELEELWQQCQGTLVALAAVGYAHGDLSAYNVLVHDGRLVMIDLPQAVNIAENPQGLAFLERDCVNICRWFTARGQPDADPAALALTLRAEANVA